MTRTSIVILCIGAVLIASLLGVTVVACVALAALSVLAPAAAPIAIRWSHAARAQRRSLLSRSPLRGPPALTA